MLQLHLSVQQVYCLRRCVLYKRFVSECIFLSYIKTFFQMMIIQSLILHVLHPTPNGFTPFRKNHMWFKIGDFIAYNQLLQFKDFYCSQPAIRNWFHRALPDITLSDFYRAPSAITITDYQPLQSVICMLWLAIAIMDSVFVLTGNPFFLFCALSH